MPNMLSFLSFMTNFYLVGWLKGVLPDGRAGWVPKSVCQSVEDPQARRQNMKNFLLSEEAQRAYQNRKQREKQSDMFVRMHEVCDTPIWSQSIYSPPLPSPVFILDCSAVFNVYVDCILQNSIFCQMFWMWTRSEWMNHCGFFSQLFSKKRFYFPMCNRFSALPSVTFSSHGITVLLTVAHLKPKLYELWYRNRFSVVTRFKSCLVVCFQNFYNTGFITHLLYILQIRNSSPPPAAFNTPSPLTVNYHRLVVFFTKHVTLRWSSP